MPSVAWQSLTAVAIFFGSLALCALGYLAFAASGPWLSAPPTLEWQARELTGARGSTRLAQGALVVAAPDASRTVVISLNTSFRARDYPVIAWDAAGIPGNLEATLLWYSDINSSRVFKRPLTIEVGRVAPAAVDQDPGWLGHIGGLALVLQGDFSQPIVVRGVAARPMSVAQVLTDTVGQWLAFEPWTGSSINGITGGSDAQDLPLPLMLALAAGLAGLIYSGLMWWWVRATGPVLGIGISVIVIAAWIAIDARWQWNLLRQARSTQVQYGGKSWSERHLAAEDGPLFSFIAKVREKLPAPPARIFMAADSPYYRYRGAYHLYPYNVYYDPASTAIPAPGLVRPDDYLVVYQRRGVQYDADQKRLRWDGNAPVAADLLLAETGAALFRIR
jgi:hypothetical protein